MSSFAGVGRTLIGLGAVLIVVGALLAWRGRLPLIGRLPGDIVWKGDGWTVYLPLGTSLLISVIASLVFGWMVRK